MKFISLYESDGTTAEVGISIGRDGCAKMPEIGAYFKCSVPDGSIEGVVVFVSSLSGKFAVVTLKDVWWQAGPVPNLPMAKWATIHENVELPVADSFPAPASEEGCDENEMVTVQWSMSVTVPRWRVHDVKKWMNTHLGHQLGDGWGWNQNISSWIEVDGETQYDY